jgi:ERCC4-type nuclease
MTPKTKPTLLVDSREKHYWDFECDDAFDKVEYRKLDAGDYSIEGLEDVIVIERKATIDELFNNFTKDKKRIAAEFDRLEDHPFKFIVIEETCDDIMNPHKYYINKKGINTQSPKMPVAVVTSNLTKLMLERNVHVIFGGLRAQAMARGILLHAYDLYRKGQLLDDKSE